MNVRTPSRAFLCILFGLGMTVFAWIGPWFWPGWPASTLLDFVLARFEPSVVAPATKAVGFVVLIIVNAAFWAVLAWAALRLREAVTRWRRT